MKEVRVRQLIAIRLQENIMLLRQRRDVWREFEKKGDGSKEGL